ncbi:FAD/NAD(P)-binding domain-containing protein [Hypoxylon sp. NC1633]|nr:FAD/NAD(P)-binding domain-containing protein [Hypoxylon sp. NC1633]
MSDDYNSKPETNLSVAIVGGGVVGVILALGLIHRNVHVTIYERASHFKGISAGFSFTGVSREAMRRINPAIVESLRRVASENQLPFDHYWDGYHHDDDDNIKKDTAASPEGNLLFQLSNSNMEWWSCLRSRFLDELSKALPPGIILFEKELAGYSDLESSERVDLHFAKGSTAVCDALIGCDGIRSRVRQQLFSSSNPGACHPSYTGKTCYRALVPMAAAEAALGKEKAHNHCMLTGPGAHILSYPIAHHTQRNTVLFLTDGKTTTAVAPPCPLTRRHEILDRLAAWWPEVRALVGLMPETPLAWPLEDTAECPPPYYARGRVCVAGDAAHASTPHHGAGACFGVEDALVLATTIALAARAPLSRRGGAVAAALGAFHDTRYQRTQWLVRSSRDTGDIYEWSYPGVGGDPTLMRAEIAARQKVIWDFDLDAMVEEANTRYYARFDGIET